MLFHNRLDKGEIADIVEDDIVKGAPLVFLKLENIKQGYSKDGINLINKKFPFIFDENFVN